MEAERRVQVRTGFFTLGVLVAAAIAILFLTREGGLFTPRYALYADFSNIEGLTLNAPVYLAGNNVGRVRSIEFRAPGEPQAVRVGLDVDARVAERIRPDSRAMIGTIGLLGDKYVELSIGSSLEPPLRGGDVVETTESATFMELAAKGRVLLDNMVELTAATERVVTSFEEEMGSRNLASLLGAMERVVQAVESEQGLVHGLFYDPEGGRLIADLRESARGVRDVVDEVRSGSGPLHELIYAADGDLPAFTSAAESARRLNSILTKVDSGQGTLGALVNDPTLYEDLKLVVGGARDSALVRGLIDYVREED
jgi:phospholipid/cholesterol/gamma-HCH transport system substrate-binding protein